MPDPYTVAVIVDPTFGDRLFDIASRTPVWIVDTPANRTAIERHWAANSGQPHTDGVTAFKVDPAASPEDWCLNVLGDVDLHHGVYSHVPPYTVLEIYGVALTQDLRAALGERGFDTVLERADGFRATVSNAAA